MKRGGFFLRRKGGYPLARDKSKPVSIPLFPQDFMGCADVQAMTYEEIGCYIWLMMLSWQLDPPCTIPSDKDLQARLLRLPLDKWLPLSNAVLIPWSDLGNGRMEQKRLRREWDYIVGKIEAGSRGGLAKSLANVKQTASTTPSTMGSKRLAPTQPNPIPMDGKPKPAREIRAGSFIDRNWDGWMGSVRELLSDIGIHGDNLNLLCASTITVEDVLREGWRIKAEGDAKKPVSLLVHRLCKAKGIELKSKRRALGTVLASQADLVQGRLDQIRKNKGRQAS